MGHSMASKKKKIVKLVYQDPNDGEEAHCPVSRKALMEIEVNCSDHTLIEFARWVLGRMGELRRKKKIHFQGLNGRDCCGKAAWPSAWAPSPVPEITQDTTKVTCAFCLRRLKAGYP